MEHGGSISVSVARMMWTYKGGVNSVSVENWKESSSSTIWTEASFSCNGKEETHNVNKTCWQ